MYCLPVVQHPFLLRLWRTVNSFALLPYSSFLCYYPRRDWQTAFEMAVCPTGYRKPLASFRYWYATSMYYPRMSVVSVFCFRMHFALSYANSLIETSRCYFIVQRFNGIALIIIWLPYVLSNQLPSQLFIIASFCPRLDFVSRSSSDLLRGLVRTCAQRKKPTCPELFLHPPGSTLEC